jgi:hypothetical protein
MMYYDEMKRLSLFILLAASCQAADLYLQSGYQRTGSSNDPYLGIGVGVNAGASAKFTGEFNFTPLASGQFTYSGPPGSFTASGRAGMLDIGGGARVRLNKDAAYEFYGLAQLGYYRFLASGSVVASGAPGMLQASSDPQSGAVISLGAGILFGSGKVRLGPEARYMRYAGDLAANAVRVGLVLNFGK